MKSFKKYLLMTFLFTFVVGGMFLGNYVSAQNVINSNMVTQRGPTSLGNDDGGNYPMNVQVNSPLPPEIKKYKPGEEFPFQIDFNYTYCINVDTFSQLAYSQPVKMGEPYELGEFDLVGVSEATRSRDYNTFSFQKSFLVSAPFEPGIYRLYYTVRSSAAVSRKIRPFIISSNSTIDYELTNNMINQLWEDHSGGPRNNEGSLLKDTKQIDGYVQFEVVADPTDLTLTCRPKTNPIPIGGTAEFEAIVSNNKGQTTTTWYDGTTIDSPILLTTNELISSFKKKFQTEGNPQLLVRTVDEDGSISSCLVGVTVVDPNKDDSVGNLIDLNGLVDTDGDGIPDTPADEVFGAGAPAATIDFSMDNSITNDTCGINWSAQHVSSCQLINLSVGSVDTISNSGSKQVTPGRYRVQCIALRDGTKVSSEILTCRQNPDVKEI